MKPSKINPSERLNSEIERLSTQLSMEKTQLADQVRNFTESIRPINLIKSAIFELSTSDEVRSGFLNTGFGLTTGFLVKNIFQLISKNPMKKGIGTILMMGISSIIGNYPETLDAISDKLAGLFSKRASTTASNIEDAELLKN